jgi:predicted nucleotidyltransferase
MASINNILTNYAQTELVIARNDTEREKINGSLDQLEKVLKSKLGNEILEIKRFGSYTRNTILPRNYDPESDVDLLVVFHSNKTPGTYRKKLSDVLTVAYPNSNIKKDFPVVKLMLNHIMFDIVPAYKEEVFYSTRYYIPDRADGWISTVPNDLNTDLSDKNQEYGNNIVRNVIRLCKCWNANAGYKFESYLMEKEILGITFWWGKNLYEQFLYILNKIAGHLAGVSQALTYIQKYIDEQNETKQLEWLNKLLPGLY